MTHDSGVHLGDEIGNAVESTLDDVTGKFREKGTALGRKAADRLEDSRAIAADGLKGAARGLHKRADAITAGADRVSAVTHRVADKVELASRYVRDTEPADVFSDIESVVRRHPLKSLLAVLAVGYFAGRAFSRDE